MKSATFSYNSKQVKIEKSNPKKDWDEVQKEIFSQICDSNVFNQEEVDQFCHMSLKDLLNCVSEDDEKIGGYNRARAIMEYKIELISAIKGGRPTRVWASGLDDLRNGVNAEDYNY